MHLKQRYSHIQVVLSIGGGESAETFPIVASNAVLRDNFARSARGLVEASGLDGIDSKFYPFTPFDSPRRHHANMSSCLGIPLHPTTGKRLPRLGRSDSHPSS